MRGGREGSALRSCRVGPERLERSERGGKTLLSPLWRSRVCLQKRLPREVLRFLQHPPSSGGLKVFGLFVLTRAQVWFFVSLLGLPSNGRAAKKRLRRQKLKGAPLRGARAAAGAVTGPSRAPSPGSSHSPFLLCLNWIKREGGDSLRASPLQLFFLLHKEFGTRKARSGSLRPQVIR